MLIRATRLAALVAALLLVGSAEHAFAAAYEPNDSFAQAHGPLVGGVEYTAVKDTVNDSDYFYFNTSGQRQLDITVTAVQGCSGGSLELLDFGGTEVGSASLYSSSSTNPTRHILYSAPYATQYVLGIDREVDTGCEYRFRIDPPDAVTTESPGLAVGLYANEDVDADDATTLTVNGAQLAVVRGQQAQRVPLGNVPPDTRIAIDMTNGAGEWSWNVDVTSLTGRVRRTLFAEEQAGGSSRLPRIGTVRHVVLTATGTVLESCGETLVSAPCFPRDDDGDGLVNGADQCVDAVGAAPSGCPDGDRDGIPDKDDRCASVAGHASAGGCPDRDGDGVVDDADGCRTLWGTAPGGCPPKQRIAGRVSLTRAGRSFRGRLTAGTPYCTKGRRVVLRRVGSGKRSFGAARTAADGTFRVRVGGRAQGRFYVVVAERGNRTQLCRVARSKARR